MNHPGPRRYYHPGERPRPRKGELVPVKPQAEDKRPLTRQQRRALEREQRKGKP